MQQLKTLKPKDQMQQPVMSQALSRPPPTGMLPTTTAVPQSTQSAQPAQQAQVPISPKPQDVTPPAPTSAAQTVPAPTPAAPTAVTPTPAPPTQVAAPPTVTATAAPQTAVAPPPQTSDPFAIVNENLRTGSPYIDVARTAAQEAANRRGLLNSSIAAGAGERAAIEAAAPFALQAGSQRSAEQLQQELFGQQTQLQAADIAAQRSLAELNIGSNKEIAQLDAETRTKIAEFDAATQANVAQLNADTQTAIANMNVAATQKSNAANTAASMASVQAQTWAGILANPNIGAEDRQALLRSTSEQLSSNLGLIEQIYNIDLQWAVPGIPAPVAAAAATTSAAPSALPRISGGR